MKNYIWMRVGDGDDYHKFSTVEEVAQHLSDHYDITKIWRFCKFGVAADGYENMNYISLFWGDENAEPLFDLIAEEIEEINTVLWNWS